MNMPFVLFPDNCKIKQIANKTGLVKCICLINTKTIKNLLLVYFATLGFRSWPAMRFWRLTPQMRVRG